MTVDRGWEEALELVPMVLECLDTSSRNRATGGISIVLTLPYVEKYRPVHRRLLLRLHDHSFPLPGTCAGYSLYQLALVHGNTPKESFTVRLHDHDHSEPIDLDSVELWEAAVGEAIHSKDLQFAGHVLQSMIQTAERKANL